MSPDHSSKPNSIAFIPPMRQGVSASKVFLPALQINPKSIYDYLCQNFQHISQQEWAQRFDEGLIYDKYGNLLTKNTSYQANQHIFYYRFLSHEIHVPFEHHILFENEHLMVIDKPHFLTMSPTGQYVQETLLVRLKQQTQNEWLTPIHRLDRETAGIVLFSKRPETRGLYQTMFADRHVQKTYHAIARFNASLSFPIHLQLRMEKGQPFYTMQIVEGIPNSETQINLIAHDQCWAKYMLRPHTGKQHQLRLHLSHLGIPIKNDPFYPILVHKDEDDFSQPLQLLAKEIQFIDPITQCAMQFTSSFELTL